MAMLHHGGALTSSHHATFIIITHYIITFPLNRPTFLFFHKQHNRDSAAEQLVALVQQERFIVT
jgi:hypothetical protein